jgi:hypothetical protein
MARAMNLADVEATMAEARGGNGCAHVKRAAGTILGASACDVWNVLLLMVLLVVAMFTGSAWLAAMGAVAYAAVVVGRAFDPAFAKRALARAERRRALPQMEAVADPELRCVVQSIRAVLDRIDSVTRHTPASVRDYVDKVLERVAALQRRAGAAIRRADALHRSMCLLDRGATGMDRIRLAALADRTPDRRAQADYQEAVSARDAQERLLADLDARQARTRAQLWRVVALMDAVPARMIHLRTVDDDAREDEGGDLSELLFDTQDELGRAEQAFSALVEPTALEDEASAR